MGIYHTAHDPGAFILGLLIFLLAQRATADGRPSDPRAMISTLGVEMMDTGNASAWHRR